MENYLINIDIEFEDKELTSLVKTLEACLRDTQKNFCYLCATIYRISNWFDSNKYYCKDKNNYWHDKYSLLGKFGFEKTAISRLSNCYVRFMIEQHQTHEVRLTPYFENFSPSKLFELLKLSERTLCESIEKDLIKPSMTVKQIREYIKQIEKGDNPSNKVLEQTQQNNENVEDEEIPMAYNPKQHYDFDYFENKSKSQLLNMIWELQKEYERLKDKRK